MVKRIPPPVEVRSDFRRYDIGFPEDERFPSVLALSFVPQNDVVTLLADGLRVGAPLTDARRELDGYRYHDALHLAFAVRLGWSPVLRALLSRKRRSDSETDRCEDGGRASMIEEAACHLVHVHREEIERGTDISGILRLLRRMTAGFEVDTSDDQDWTEAMRLGIAALNALRRNDGGTLLANFAQGTLVHQPHRIQRATVTPG